DRFHAGGGAGRPRSVGDCRHAFWRQEEDESMARIWFRRRQATEAAIQRGHRLLWGALGVGLATGMGVWLSRKSPAGRSARRDTGAGRDRFPQRPTEDVTAGTDSSRFREAPVRRRDDAPTDDIGITASDSRRGLSGGPELADRDFPFPARATQTSS